MDGIGGDRPLVDVDFFASRGGQHFIHYDLSERCRGSGLISKQSLAAVRI